MQGDFTKEETKRIREVVKDLFAAVPKSKKMGYLGHLNDIMLYLSEAERAAKDESK